MSVERLLRGQFKEICSCGDSIEVHGEGIWADKLMGILAEWRADHHHHEARTAVQNLRMLEREMALPTLFGDGD